MSNGNKSDIHAASTKENLLDPIFSFRRHRYGLNSIIINPKGLAQVVEALVLRFAPFKVQGSASHGCKQSFGAIHTGEKPVI
jgi:hypothetical protein